ncbi:MAG: tRNA pseudouridine(55) synthase TruB [Chloroflexi bacterium]|nr:tRNA pseudouridine(55) synthase TruB [Chloroflexota bacterium]
MARDRTAGSGLDGILIVSKPPGPTSHDIVALVRRLSGTKRVGHGGTLDPFAGGVLPLFLGRATRVVEYHLGDRKAYRATVCFGATSTTDDLDGELIPVDGPGPTREAVEAALPALQGRVTQTPPIFSAIKVGGRRAYALARAGEAVEMRPREVEIWRLELLTWDDTDPARPIAVLDVECSAGTYVRAIARDVGAAVGSGAYLAALVRMASGPFQLDDAIPLDDIRAAAGEGTGQLAALLRPIDTGLEHLAAVALTAGELGAFARGQHIRPDGGVRDIAEGAIVRVTGPDGELLGIARVGGGRLAPDKVLVEVPPSTRAPDPVGALRVVGGVDELRPEDGPLFAAVGVFDGLHRGHRYLLDELVRHAARLGARPAVITFDSHPDQVLLGAAPPLLLDPAERLRLIGEAGVAVVVVQHFDEALRATPYDAFIHRITDRTRLAGLLMTPDAAFGHERRGTPEALAALGRRSEPPWVVVVVPPFTVDDRPVSSSEIRRLVAAGDLTAAERLLGRPYGVTGLPDPDDPGRLRFPLPVALPPAGRHRVRRDGRHAVAIVGTGDSGLVVEDPELGTDPVTVRFTAG